MEKIEALFNINIMGYNIGITEGLIVQWVILVLVALACILLTRNLKKIPDAKQSILEIFVLQMENLVKGNMGDKYAAFVPFVGTIVIFVALLNLTPLLGFKAPTEDINICAGISMITFLVIQGYTIKKVGILHYFTGYAKPMSILLPINILERIMLPVSLSLRLFGNITAGAVIMKLLYDALSGFNSFAQIGIPIPFHFYFDVFDGLIQMFIFTMLTMVNIKIVSEH